MITIPKTIGAISSAFILCIGLSYAFAAHPQAETHPSDDRGSQGNQDRIKGDSTPKKGQDEKVDEAKLKEDKEQAREEFDQRNAKGQEQMNLKVPKRTLQNN
jgi:predicted metal-dependent hydrolase